MPQAIPFIAGMVGATAPALGTAAFGAWVAGVGASSFLTTTIVGKLLTTVALTALSRALQPKPKTQASGVRTEHTMTGGTTPASFVLGRYATEGQLVAPPMSHGQDGGTPNAYLTYVIELGDIPGQTLDGVMIDGEPVTLGATPHADYGLPVEGRHAEYAWIKYYDGTQTVADPMLLARYGADPDRPWASDMIGAGIPYAICTFRLKRDLYSGFPRVRFVMGGIPLYDPRKDTTVGGSGAHRWATPATWEVSENPAVQAYNIFRGIALPGGDIWGGGMAASDLPLDNWFAAMNAADAAVALSGGGSEAAYRSSYEVLVADEPASVIEELLKTCSGQVSEVGGVWKVRIGGPGLPVLFFSDDDVNISESQSFEPFPGIGGTYNGIHASYPDPGALWQSTDAPPRYNSTYETQDGDRRLVADLTLPAAPYPDQVQRIMRAYIEEERRMRRHTLTLAPEAIALEPLDCVAWTSARNGYTAKDFEVAAIIDPLVMSKPQVSLRERDPADYDWTPSFELPTSIPSLVIGTPGQYEIFSWSVTASTVNDASGAGRRPAILFAWSVALDDIADVAYEIRVKVNADAVAAGSFGEFSAGGAIVSAGLIAATEYEARIRPVPVGARTGKWTAWLSVTTPDVRFSADDIEDGLRFADAPTGLALTTSLIDDGLARVEATWTAATNAVAYELGVVENGGNEVILGVGGTRRHLDVLPGTSITVRVRSVAALGGTSAWTATQNITAAADTTPPAVPTGVTAVAGFGTIWVEWNANVETDLSHYEIVGKGNSTTPATNPSGVFMQETIATTFVHSGLAENYARWYFVRAVDTSGNKSDWSAFATATTPSFETIPNPPGAPSGLAYTTELTGDGEARVRVTWTGGANTVGYEISVTPTGGNSANTMAGETAFAFLSLPGATYSVKVRAHNATGVKSAWSGDLAVTAAVDSVAPAVPTGFAAQGTFEAFWLTWAANSETDFARYEIARKTVTTPPTNQGGTVDYVAAGTTLVITDEDPGTTAHFFVRAVDTSGNLSDWSAVASATTIGLDGTQTAPATPTGLALTTALITGRTDRAQVVATWNSVTDAVAYDVTFTRDGFSGSVYQVGASPYVQEVTAGLVYKVRVRAINMLGQKSAWSDYETITAAADSTPPAVPTGLALTPGFGTFWLEWNAATESDFLRHEVLEQAAATPAPNAGTAASWNVTASTLSLTGYDDGITRWFWVRAVDTSGNKSAWTAAVTGTTLAIGETRPAPATPTGLAASSTWEADGRSRINISWNAVTGAVGYQLGVTRTGGNETLHDVGAIDFEFATLPGAGYSVRVRAKNDVNTTSGWSGAVAVTAALDAVKPATPTGLAVTGAFNGFWLEWDANSEADLKEYQVWRNGDTTPPGSGALIYSYTTPATSLFVEWTGGQTRYFWIRAVDTSGNRSAWSAMVTATSLETVDVLDTADLAGLVDMTSFAAGLTGVEVVATLPSTGNFAGRTCVLTTDGKLYRYTGGVWSKAVDGIDLIADSVTTGAIAAGAVKAAQIDAGAVTAQHMAIGDFTNTMSGASGEWDKAPFDLTGQTYAALSSVTAHSGTESLNLKPGSSSVVKLVSTARMEVTEGEELYAEAWVYRGSGFVHNTEAKIRFGDQDGTYLAQMTIHDTATTNTWTLISKKITVPAGVTHIQTAIWFDHSAGNAYVDDMVLRKRLKGELIVDGAITADHVGTNEIIALAANIADATITSAKITGLTADKIDVPASGGLDPLIQVGATGTTIGTVESRAADPAARINAGTTVIGAGNIEIWGTTADQLTDWRKGGDVTRIDGGNLATNTVSANKLTIGNRGVSVQNVRFEPNSPASDQVSWSAGAIRYEQDNGTSVSRTIASGNATHTGTRLYIYYTKGTTDLNVGTDATAAGTGDNVIVATYDGDTDLTVNYGQTVIDGDHIKTGAVEANHIKANTITAGQLSTGELITLTGQIKNAIITDAKISDLSAAKLTAGDIATGGITVDNRALAQVVADARLSRAYTSMVALAPRICPVAGTVYYAAKEDDSIIWNNGEIVVDGTKTGTITVAAGDVLEVNKPVALAHVRDMLMTMQAAGRSFYDYWSRNDTLTYYIYSQTGTTATITVGTGSDQTVAVGAGALVAHVAGTTWTTSQTVTITATADIVVFRDTPLGDAYPLWPLALETVGRGTGSAPSGTITSTADSTTGFYYCAFSEGGVQRAAGDGGGGDGETGIPIDALGTHYVLPFDMHDYTIVAVEPCTVRLFSKTGTKLATHSLTSASKTAPQGVQVGNLAGDSATLIALAGGYFVGTAPFFLRSNNPNGDYEYAVHGWREDLRPAFAAVSLGSASENVARWANNPAARINDPSAPATLIDPGKITIWGGNLGQLADFRHGTDWTQIDGGHIAANTITANKLTIGNRSVTAQDIEFAFDKDTDTISWSSGGIRYIDQNGASAWRAIAASTAYSPQGDLTHTGARMWVYWVEGATALSVTTVSTTAFVDGNVVLTTYNGGSDMTTDVGRTIIDGDWIKTGTIDASHIDVDDLVVSGLANISTAYIDEANISGTLSAALISAGTALAGSVTVSGTALSTVESRAADPASRVNAGSVKIDPGKITISGATTLQDWRGVSDTTVINGGKIETNSIDVRSLRVGDFSNLLVGGDMEDKANMPFDVVEADGVTMKTGYQWATTAKTGARSLRIDVGASPVAARSGPFAVLPGEKLYIEFHARRDAAYDGPTTNRVRVNQLDTTLIDDVSFGLADLASFGTWYKLSGEITIPAGVTQVEIKLNATDHTAGYVYIDDILVRRMLGGELIVDGSITASHITANTIGATELRTDTAVITGTAQIADAIITNAKISDLSAAKLTAGTALAGSITVDGTALSTVEDRAADPAARVNAASTLIDPGKITISGATTLQDWRKGGDLTKIDGGSISANTISANRLTLGNRGVTFDGFDFITNAATNTLSWGGGSVRCLNNSGVYTWTSVAAGSMVWSGTLKFLYWTFGAGTFSETTVAATAHADDNIVVAIYAGGTDLDTQYGRTIIDGAHIKTGTIEADHINVANLSAISANLGTLSVGTLNIAGNAVTIPARAWTGGALTISSTSTWTNVVGVYVSRAGYPTDLAFSAGIDGYGSGIVELGFFRGTTHLQSVHQTTAPGGRQSHFTARAMDFDTGTGGVSYWVKARKVDSSLTGGWNKNIRLMKRLLIATQFKR